MFNCFIVYYSYMEETPSNHHVFPTEEEAKAFIKRQNWDKPWHIVEGKLKADTKLKET